MTTKEKDKKGVLVNLSVEQYEEFKKFCNDKGATMASFTRQLIFQAMKGDKQNDK